MNYMRRVLWLLLMTFFALPLPAIAAKPVQAIDKAYSLLVTPFPEYDANSEIIAPVRVTAVFTNEAPPSSAASNISSLVLVLSLPGVTIVNDPSDPLRQPSATSGTPLVTMNNTAIQVTGMTPLKGKQEFTLEFYVTSCGDSKWDATVYSGSSLSGDTFKRVNDAPGDANLYTIVKCGTVACGFPFSVADVTPTANPFMEGERGAYNADGTCAPIDYFVSNRLVTQGQVHFRWPVTGTNAQPNAAFKYTVFLTAATPPLVAWLNPNGSKAENIDGDTPVYIPAPTCLSDDLPAPYGSLNQHTNANTLQIKVGTSPNSGAVIPVPPVPFPILIGSERMQVLNVQGTTWTVEARGAGDTDADNHPSGALVMSTPLPLLGADSPPYTLGDQAHACRVTGPTPLGTDPETWGTEFINIGDPWVRLPSN